MLLVLGWVLIEPPKMPFYGAPVWDMNAPLSAWSVLTSFDSEQDCKDWKANADAAANQVRPTFDVDRCVASNDDPQSVE
jgi:hypothetical protein